MRISKTLLIIEQLDFNIISYNIQEKTIIVAINGVKYVWVYGPNDDIDNLYNTALKISKYSPGKALAFLKGKYTSYQKFDEPLMAA